MMTMLAWSRCFLLAGGLGASTFLAGCNLVPPEGPSLIAQRPNRDFGPSKQRQDADGYPLLGAFPGAAAPQLDSGEVASDRTSMLSSARRQNNEVRSAAAEYNQSVAEARRIRAQHDRDVSAMTSIEIQRNAARKSNEDVLKQIEQGGAAPASPESGQ